MLSLRRDRAKLTLDDAVQHLYHFCATLPASSYVDLRPIFIFEENSPRSEGEFKSISARVILPISVDVSLRETRSLCRWKTEKMARQDAAFEAYAALYQAGLVNEHLLPIGHVQESVEEAYKIIEKRPSLVEVSETFNSWISLAKQWEGATEVMASTVKVCHGGHTIADMILLLPRSLPKISTFPLHWDAITTFDVTISPSATSFDLTITQPATQITLLLLRSIFQKVKDGGPGDFTTMFLPNGISDYSKWVKAYTGGVRADHVYKNGIIEGAGLLRDLTQSRMPHVFHDVRYATSTDVAADGPMDINRIGGEKAAKSDEGPNDTLAESISSNDGLELDLGENPETCVLIEMTRLTKKTDFLHCQPARDAKIAKKSKARVVLAQTCEMDRLPFEYSRFAILIPSVLHKVQTALVVDQLCETILAPLHLSDRELLKTAISAPSAQEATNYNRLEFLGDSLLKFFASLTMMAEHLNFHEGILAHKKDHIVSNGSLARAAMDTGLDRFIITKPFTGLKWQPPCNSELLHQLPGKRDISTKTLADVVEALIGAAYLEGESLRVLECLELFLPRIPWSTAVCAVEILYGVYETQISLSTQLDHIEQLISYRFKIGGLLAEALTHPSFYGPNISASYERLEFLGDSVLDIIVTKTVYTHDPPIDTHNLHLIRTALVNGNFLGYLCLMLSTTLQRFDPVSDDPNNISITSVSYSFYLWQSMRHSSPAIREAQQACVTRLSVLKAEISESFTSGKSYPWRLLARLQPPKFISDIIESLLGAIYIDMHGSLDACESFLEHLGLMPYLRRVMQEHTSLLHPKQELGELADGEKVRYVLGNEGEEVERRLTCSVLVGEREVVRVGDGSSPMEVQTRAADEACAILRKERDMRIREKLSSDYEGKEWDSNEDGERGEKYEAEERYEQEVDERGKEGGIEVESMHVNDDLTGESAGGCDSDEYMTANE